MFSQCNILNKKFNGFLIPLCKDTRNTGKMHTRLAVVTDLVAVFLFPFINNVAKSLILLGGKVDG